MAIFNSKLQQNYQRVDILPFDGFHSHGGTPLSLDVLFHGKSQRTTCGTIPSSTVEPFFASSLQGCWSGLGIACHVAGHWRQDGWHQGVKIGGWDGNLGKNGGFYGVFW